MEHLSSLRSSKALLRTIVLIEHENMLRGFRLEAHSFEHLHKGLFSLLKDCFSFAKGLFFPWKDVFFNSHTIIQVEKRHDEICAIRVKLRPNASRKLTARW